MNSTRKLLMTIPALALLAGACSSSDDLGDATALTSAERPPLVLEAALSPGEDPFTDSASAVSEADVDAATDVAHDEVELPEETSDDAVALLPGDSPGLYGGTGDEATCDTAAISRYLGADLAKAEAWADAQGIGVHGIDPFLDTLTPMVLLHDTRVTNHGYRDGVATPFQSVLQAGTAVLVDPYGVPRVRCACGNPLDAPDTSVSHEPVGTPWPGYGNTPVVIVTEHQPVNVFITINIHTGAEQAVPAGSDATNEPPGDEEGPIAEPPRTTTTTTTTTPVFDGGDVHDVDPTTCLSRYAELVVLLTPLGLDPLTAAQWSERNMEAVNYLEAGMWAEGTELICDLVLEMEAAYLDLSGGA
ncbi:MAG: hypothetical protein GY812_00690 [Actinomycetia bacterium]|nr:hypothetical protein [Actinomycetes bacterium]